MKLKIAWAIFTFILIFIQIFHTNILLLASEEEHCKGVDASKRRGKVGAMTSFLGRLHLGGSQAQSPIAISEENEYVVVGLNDQDKSEEIEEEDYILKFKGRVPYTFKEAKALGLIPDELQDKPPHEIIEAMSAELEDVMILQHVLTFLKSPDGEIVPMTLAEARRIGGIYTIDEIKDPQKIVLHQKAAVYDLRKFLINIEKEGSSDKSTIPLSLALLQGGVSMSEAVEVLLKKTMGGVARIYQSREGQPTRFLTDPTPGSHLDGFKVDTQTYERIGASPGHLAMSARANVFDAPTGTSSGGYFFADTKGMEVGGDFRTQFGQLVPWYGFASNFHGFGLSGIVNIDLLHALQGGAFVAVGNNYAGVSVGGSLTSQIGTIAAAVFVFKTKDRVVYLSLPEKKYADLNMYQVVITDSSGGGARLSLGLGEPTTGLGVGIRGGRSKKFTTYYKTHLPRELALRYQKDGEMRGVRRIGRAFQTKDLPKIEDPLQWDEGDEVVTTRTGSYFGAFILGVSNLPVDVKFGHSYEVTGSYEISIKKLAGSKVEVTINPTRIEEKGVFVQILGVAGASRSSGVALALKQKFIFDLSSYGPNGNFEAMTAYNELITSGRLPNMLSDDLNLVEEDYNPGHLVEQLKIENRGLLGKGITRTSMEIVLMKHQKLTATLGLHCYGLPGLSTEHLRANGKRIVASDSGAVRSYTIMDSISGDIFKKSKRKLAMATRNSLWLNPKPGTYSEEFKNIVLTVDYSNSQLSASDYQEMWATLKQVFHMDFRPFVHSGVNENRTVVLERKLEIDELESLRERPDEDIWAAKQYSGVPMSDIDQFIGSIRTSGPGDIAKKVIKFIDDHGMFGVGAIHYMLGGSVKDIKIRTTSSLYDNPIDEAEQFVIKWSDPKASPTSRRKIRIKVNSQAKEINEFFSEGMRILPLIRLGLEQLELDQFMLDERDPRNWPEGIRETKDAIRENLREAREMVLELMDLESQGMAELIQEKIFLKVKCENLSIYQKMFLLRRKYYLPIKSSDTRVDIRERFEYCEAVRRDILTERESVIEDRSYPDGETERITLQLDGYLEEIDDEILSLKAIKRVSDFEELIDTMNNRQLTMFTFYETKLTKEMEIRGIFEDALQRRIQQYGSEEDMSDTGSNFGYSDLELSSGIVEYDQAVLNAKNFLLEWTDPKAHPSDEKYVDLRGHSSSKKITKFYLDGREILSSLRSIVVDIKKKKVEQQEDEGLDFDNLLRILQQAKDAVRRLMNLEKQFSLGELKLIYKKIKRENRGITHKFVLFRIKYTLQIMPGDSREEIRERFIRAEELLDEIKDKRASLLEDESYEKHEREGYRAKLARYHDEIIRKISFDHLKNEEDFLELEKTMDNKHYRRSRTALEIMKRDQGIKGRIIGALHAFREREAKRREEVESDEEDEDSDKE